MDIFLRLVLLALGFVMLIKGADWLVGGAAGLAEKFKIPKMIIALTIISMGTSSPEAAVSISSALKGDAGIAVGNVVGSNIFNILIILGICACIGVIRVNKKTFKFELPFLIAISLVFLLMGLDGTINLVDAIILLAIFAAYLIYVFTTAGTDNAEESNSKAPPKKLWLLILLLAVGIVLVVWGADLVVDSATFIAEKAGMSERFIGLTIVAFGTSLPELVTSITAVRKGECDLAVGNVVGSNIFNLIFIIGITGVITPVPFESKFLIDTAISAGAALLLWLFCIKDRTLKIPAGITFLAAYAAYFVYLCLL